jgi:hypothetical protein
VRPLFVTVYQSSCLQSPEALSGLVSQEATSLGGATTIDDYREAVKRTCTQERSNLSPKNKHQLVPSAVWLWPGAGEWLLQRAVPVATYSSHVFTDYAIWNREQDNWTTNRPNVTVLSAEDTTNTEESRTSQRSRHNRRAAIVIVMPFVGFDVFTELTRARYTGWPRVRLLTNARSSLHLHGVQTGSGALTASQSKDKNCIPCNRPCRPIRLWDVKDPTLYRHSTHRWR